MKLVFARNKEIEESGTYYVLDLLLSVLLTLALSRFFKSLFSPEWWAQYSVFVGWACVAVGFRAAPSLTTSLIVRFRIPHKNKPDFGVVDLWLLFGALPLSGLIVRQLKEHSAVQDNMAQFLIGGAIAFSLIYPLRLGLKRFAWFQRINNSERVGRLTLVSFIWTCAIAAVIGAVWAISDFMRTSS